MAVKSEFETWFRTEILKTNHENFASMINYQNQFTGKRGNEVGVGQNCKF